MANRNKYSLFNAMSAMALTMANGLFSIIVTRLVLAHFGSDFNGLNSTANQIVNVLLVLEGGFTLASNVALFSPLTEADDALVNGILSATAKKFRQIGLIFLGIGALVTLGYAFAANSALPRGFIATVIIMTVFPAAFNLFYATTYRVLLQAQQREYIISLITLCTVSAGHILNIIMVTHGGRMWMVRFTTMTMSLINSFLIAWYVRRKNKFIDLKVPPRRELIRGTGDVMVQKITGVIYESAPIVFLSVSPTGGTMLASVYAVYNNVFVMLKSLLHGIIDAPRLGIGQMLTERKREDAWPVFAQYEYAAFLAVFALMTTGYVLILPFIGIYTDGITDIGYYDARIALLMVLIAAMEMIHIPSGHLINMAGLFRVSRNLQVIACIVLILTMSVGGILWGVYGMLAAILITAVLLAMMEIGYVHVKFFPGKLAALLRLVLPLAAAGVLTCVLELRLPVAIGGYVAFALYGVVFGASNCVLAALVGILFNRPQFMALVRRGLRLLRRG